MATIEDIVSVVRNTTGDVVHIKSRKKLNRLVILLLHDLGEKFWYNEKIAEWCEYIIKTSLSRRYNFYDLFDNATPALRLGKALTQGNENQELQEMSCYIVEFACLKLVRWELDPLESVEGSTLMAPLLGKKGYFLEEQMDRGRERIVGTDLLKQKYGFTVSVEEASLLGGSRISFE